MPLDQLLRMLAAEQAKIEAAEAAMIDVTPEAIDAETAA
jgi:hypothetical protein